MSRCFWLIGALGLSVVPTAHAQGTPAISVNPLMRQYREGEALHYHMHATNRGRAGTLQYDADAVGRVVRDSAGHFIDALEWTRLIQNDTARRLAAGTAAVQQRLAFAPGFLIPPDVAHTDPALDGPVLDLFTFYVDLWLAARSPALAAVGVDVRIPGSGSNTWATGPSVIAAADAIDFVIRVTELDSVAHRATVLVRHLPPDPGRVALPATWMQTPVTGSPNNWVEIEATGTDFSAAVGHEEFDVQLTVDLRNGEILHAVMENPVDVVERHCADRALAQCGAPLRYQILRRITVDRVD